jgi:hypothetical protein
MGSKVIRNVTKILKATSGRLFGRVTAGTGRAEELTASDVRGLLEVYTTSEVDGLIENIELIPGPPGNDGVDGADGDTGPQGPAGPNEVSGTTATALDGILRGTGTVVGTVTVSDGLSYSAGSLSVSFGNTSTSACVGNDARLSDARTPTSHKNTHVTGGTDAFTDAEIRSLLGVSTLSGSNTGDQNLFSTIAVSGQSNVVADQASDTLTLVAGTNITITTDASTDTITIAASGGGLSGTGSVDNAVLRADGTGGATLQNSNWIIADNATASPNNTVNHASLQATGGTTNVSVSIVPKGTGAFSLSVPDGTSAGGNARGANAIDLQTSRSAAAQVASGATSFIACRRNTASGVDSYALGFNSTASGNASGAFGEVTATTGRASNSFGGYNTVSGTTAGCSGNQITVSSFGGWGTGNDAHCDLMNQVAVGAKRFATLGDCQATLGVPIKSATSDATPTELLAQEAFTNTTSRLSLRNNSAWAFEITIIARSTSGANHASFVRRGLIYRNANAASTALEGAVQTIGTDIASAGASTWAVAITADTTNGSLKIEFTGQAATSIRATGFIRMAEVGFA